MKRYSFSTNGFCFHLTQVSGDLYKDQTGGEWHRSGNKLISAGGCYRYTIQPMDCMDGKEAFQYIRQSRQGGDRDGFLHDRFLYIHS